ncbi:MAG: hypothetical protein JO013_11080 [Alphaproteobacteria bacterium]|nr:hypothetical protein [Alphaproteobacteria bacterium]
MGLDVGSLVQDMLGAGKAVLNQDLPALRGFSEQQLEAIARQAILIAEGVADGSIDPATRDYFLKSLAEMTRSFVNTLAGLAAVTAEKLWNGIVGVLWGAINKATGLNLFPPAGGGGS